jgi:hypothetical protein
MAAVIAAAALAAGQGELDGRLAEAAGAEQALQGALDGSWTLRDGHGRGLCALRISDSIDGPLGGAWRDSVSGALGIIAGGSRGGGHVYLKLVLDGVEHAWLILRPAAPGRWRGRMIIAGHSLAVTLARAPR